LQDIEDIESEVRITIELPEDTKQETTEEIDHGPPVDGPKEDPLDSELPPEGEGTSRDDVKTLRGEEAAYTGRDAQEWLRRQLKDRLSDTDWSVSDRTERDSKGRESDIVLRHKIIGTYHIEVKHSKEGLIYWSENQVEKAQGLSGHYFMAILKPSDRDSEESRFNEFWLTDPLKQLSDFEYAGVWTLSNLRPEQYTIPFAKLFQARSLGSPSFLKWSFLPSQRVLLGAS